MFILTGGFVQTSCSIKPAYFAHRRLILHPNPLQMDIELITSIPVKAGQMTAAVPQGAGEESPGSAGQDAG